MYRSVLALAMLLVPALAGTGAASGIEIAGSELIVTTDDGRTLRATDLVGAVMTVAFEGAADLEVRLDAIALDDRAFSDDVFLYDLSFRDTTGVWAPLCEPDPHGGRHAILQPGPDGRIGVWCTAGTYAKCIRFGYRPWAKGPNGEDLRPFHAACNKMLRADYCGDDQPTTRTGMLVDIYDSMSMLTRTPGEPDVTFEAAWDTRGAICVAHPRVPQNIDLDTLVAQCPRLKGRVGEDCTPETAARWGTPILFNGSRGDGIIEAERVPQ